MSTHDLARLFGAALLGVWLAGTVVALLALWRRRSVVVAEAPPPAIEPAPARLSRQPFAPDLSANVFNLSPLPIWWVDRDLRLAGANDAYARAVGYPTAEGAVRADAELASGTRSLAAEARRTDRTVVGEARVVIAGERRLLEIIAIPVLGGDVVHLALDETHRHAAHTAANTRARALAEALDELPTGVALFDATSTLLQSNIAFARMFLIEPAWLEMRPDFRRVLDMMRDGGRLPETIDFAAWAAARRAWFAAEDAIEEVWMLPGGTILRVHARPRDGGLHLLFEDETERTRLAAEREQLLRVHTATLENLREGVAVFGPDGRLRLFNRRFAEIVVASPETLAEDMPAERLMEHIAGLLDDPAKAGDLRQLIVTATVGRTALSGRTTSRLGYVVDVAAVPLPDGNALITCTAVERAAVPDA